MTVPTCQYGGVSLDSIRNFNEQHVLEQLPAVLAEFPGFEPDYLDIQDIYALALNNLPPRYMQKMSVNLRESVHDTVVRETLRQAVDIVRDSPNY